MINNNNLGYLNDEFKRGKFVEFNVSDLQKALTPLLQVIRKKEYKQYFYIFSKNKKLEILFKTEFFQYFTNIDVLNQDNSKYLEDLFTVDAYDFMFMLKKIPKDCRTIRFYKKDTVLTINIDGLTDASINDYTVDKQEIAKIIARFKYANKEEKLKFERESFKDFLQITALCKEDLKGYFYIKDKTAYYIHEDNDTYIQKQFSFVINNLDLPNMVVSTKHLKFFYNVCKNFDKNIVNNFSYNIAKIEIRFFNHSIYVKISDRLQLILYTIHNTNKISAIFDERMKITQENLSNEIYPVLKTPIYVKGYPNILLKRLEIFIKQNDILNKGIVKMKIKNNTMFLFTENNCKEFARDSQTFFSDLSCDDIDILNEANGKSFFMYSAKLLETLKSANTYEKNSQRPLLFLNKNNNRVCLYGGNIKFIIYHSK
ncbi:hypothetical protein IJ541_04370 [bacterium]|nr:hypothetical protein [bacterium]